MTLFFCSNISRTEFVCKPLSHKFGKMSCQNFDDFVAWMLGHCASNRLISYRVTWGTVLTCVKGSVPLLWYDLFITNLKSLIQHNDDTFFLQQYFKD